MIYMICALGSGISIVVSRQVNGYLASKCGVYQSTFFNFFTGSIISFIMMLLLALPYLTNFSLINFYNNPTMILGGILGVFNIIILNIVVSKISPVKLTIITLISQLLCGMILDYAFYNIFSIQKVIGCIIVIFGLFIYQLSEKKD